MDMEDSISYIIGKSTKNEELRRREIRTIWRKVGDQLTALFRIQHAEGI